MKLVSKTHRPRRRETPDILDEPVYTTQSVTDPSEVLEKISKCLTELEDECESG